MSQVTSFKICKLFFISLIIVFLSNCSSSSSGDDPVDPVDPINPVDPVDPTNPVPGETFVCENELDTCFDIIYVRFPYPVLRGIAAGESPYNLVEGADLMLLKQDGSQLVLVDCTTCSVMDPFISYDGNTVYYSHNEKIGSNPFLADNFESWIYKIHLETHPDFDEYKPIRLTYNDGFDSVLFKANQASPGVIKPGHDQSDYRPIRDMAPVPLADGRLLFTSNRSALTTFHPRTDAIVKGSVQQLYVMDDHDGTAVTRELANMHVLETGNIHMVQHPMQLMDGRILFSTWQDAVAKFGSFQYGQMPLFTVHPDGSNLRQFTEPHDHHKNVEHFISQLSDGQVVWAQYYPQQDGFGIIMRAPTSSPGPDFLREHVDQRYTHGNPHFISFREFDRKGTVTLTPHTDPGDVPAPNASGKYSMPSGTNDGGLLVSYTTGYANETDFACSPSGQCEEVKSGIYFIKNADGDESDFILDPVTDLLKVVDDPNYNEIWPRAVLSYQQIYGLPKPNALRNLALFPPDDIHLLAGEAKAIVGTSSMYNREDNTGNDADDFGTNNSREQITGNWVIQGSEAGIFTNDDIYGVRIIATPPKPYTSPIKRSEARWDSISRHLLDTRLEYVVARYGSDHGERWEILGEFPVKKQSITDAQGNPDTSWLAKIPADSPFLIQTIDNKGMTLISEITWRALKSGEKRADCGGCHAHSLDPLDLATTEAGNNMPIVNIAGVDSKPEIVTDGIWDLTQNSIPLLNDAGVTFEPGYSYGVEFTRDILPILDNECVSCHTSTGTDGAELFILDGSGGLDPWEVILKTGSSSSILTKKSRYIRTPQARQSLFVWAAWGERLDGRDNITRSDDIDFSAAAATIHSALTISDQDKRTIARWVDLGGPIDFPVTDGVGYTDDYQLPVVNLYTPHLGSNTGSELKVGFADAMSGLDFNTLEVKYFKIDAAFISQLPADLSTVTDIDAAIMDLKQLIADSEIVVPTSPSDVSAKNILTKDLALGAGQYVITVSVNDVTGNTGIAYRRFTIN